MARVFDDTLGSDPEHQDRPQRWLGCSILHNVSYYGYLTLIVMTIALAAGLALVVALV